MYLKTDDGCTWVISEHEPPYLSSHNIGHLLPLFPGFVRIRKGVLVNPVFVKAVYHALLKYGLPAMVEMNDDTLFMVSIRRTKAVQAILSPATGL